ncbi:MAG: hypothetical protein HN833_04440 [Elusimicrobiaceae bacterium]|jgi:hypothetical protein|nr:hypothetical protein [Elusimicrobiaceae bacterium]MBT3954905.1 hypothetical protein [Elusimicrobiaceae bacterium]MBT4008357.1 hypothetical protein [Elusimicrobiaceae bacterium]MBT4403432.1 hypothetical protein [Elusimicrobiaceae bacterium]MBT4440454.1 hypothetical protein [Elusimicrobiaceae bacterium]
MTPETIKLIELGSTILLVGSAVFTIIYTVRSFNEAQKNKRPYLFVKKTEFDKQNDGNFTHTVWTINQGRIPAKNYEIKILQFYKDPKSNKITKVKDCSQKIPNNFPPSGCVPSWLKNINPVTTNYECYFLVLIKYEDVLSNKKYLDKSFQKWIFNKTKSKFEFIQPTIKEAEELEKLA